MKSKSQKGKCGKVGAPQKPVKFPARPFTIEAAIKLNKCKNGGPCELTVRKRVTAALKGFYVSNGVKVTVPKTLTKGEPIPQPNGKVGRPKFRFMPITVASKTVRPTKPKTVRVVTVVPKTPTASVNPTPSVTTPVVTSAPIVSVTNP